MSYGPTPWQQAHWDWRAAGNFVCGGAGAGLLVFAAFGGTEAGARAALILLGLALVGAGLSCVWLEIGRPWRALHVFFNPRTSWMSREAFAAALLFPAGLAGAAGYAPAAWAAGLLALAFLYCQARILRASRGIPAWRQPGIVPLIVATGLTEGCGLYLVLQPVHGSAGPVLMAVFAALVALRWANWVAYRRRLGNRVAAPARAALDRAGDTLQRVGSYLAFALIAPVGIGLASGLAAQALAVAAGAAAAFAGANLKHTLITRAGFNQGFALAALPVRGARL
ncbi:hypothetical protein M6I34_00835 [Burkholderiaceae bacterium FT117]|uniref:NrfD/PsrC family molybdoenzyme membrane anchor subunit n=1 Tax=Zeimonas sediminis TaxID=2944268 RepID=UPI002342E884|nr:NrfD/PsrC family molybdoenzyme membrane anchor subunit [Zeimonas sediminis]MCM5569046.1 hypothetical protein [Zeimonas sediminis]